MSENLTQWTMLVGILTPVITSVIQQPRWRRSTRALMAVLVSILMGVGTVYFTDPSALDSGMTVTVVLGILTASTASYKTLWEPLGIRKLENITSPNDYTMDIEAAIEAEMFADEQ